MKLFRHLAGYAPVNIAAAIASFGGVYVFTRLLGADEYGRYAVMLSALAIIHTISLSWAEAAGYRFAGRAEENGATADHHRTGLRLDGAVFTAQWADHLLLARGDMERAAIPSVSPILCLAPADDDDYPDGARSSPRRSACETLCGRRDDASIARFTVIGALACLAKRIGSACTICGITCRVPVLFAVSEGAWLFREARGGRSSAQARAGSGWDTAFRSLRRCCWISCCPPQTGS